MKQIRKKIQKWLLISIMLVSTTLVFAQKSTKELVDSKNDKVKIEEFKVALNMQFTKITTGTAFSSLGNYASVSSDAKSFTLGGNIVKKESVFGFELSGGATEGILKIIENEKLNSNFGLELKYNKLLKTDFAARDVISVSKIEEEINDLHIQFTKDSIAIAEKQELYKIQSELLNTKLNILKQQRVMSKIDSLLKVDDLSSYKKDSLNIAKGLLTYEIAKIKNDTINISRRLSKIKEDEKSYFLEELEKKEQIRDAKWIELDKKKKDLALEGFDITWLSFGLKANNNSFKLFEENIATNRQFIDTNFVSQRFTAAISRYRSTSFQNQDAFWSAGIYIDYTSSFDALNKVTVEERKPIATDSSKQIAKTINAYKGDYTEGIIEFTLFYDYYRFFGKYNSIVGLHINPSCTISESNKKPITNLVIGIIVPFGDKEKQSSKINVEIFYSKQDVFNYLDNDKSFVGIRATLPINLINNKS